MCKNKKLPERLRDRCAVVIDISMQCRRKALVEANRREAKGPVQLPMIRKPAAKSRQEIWEMPRGLGRNDSAVTRKHEADRIGVAEWSSVRCNVLAGEVRLEPPDI